MFTLLVFLSKKCGNRTDAIRPEVKFETLNTSIVVLAETHNPSILHPAFLTMLGIVPQEWKLAEPPVCTPLVSVVKYENKIAFKAEPSKFMVLSEDPAENSPLAEVVSKYVEALPHVPYTAVGTNVAGFIECVDPESWVVKRFVKEGPGNDKRHSPKGATIKLMYKLEKGILAVNCDPGTVRKKDEPTERPCLLINGNIHMVVPQESRREGTLAAVNLHSANIARFMEIVQIVFGLEEP